MYVAEYEHLQTQYLTAIEVQGLPLLVLDRPECKLKSIAPP